MGAAVPRAAADPGRCATGPRQLAAEWPGLRRHARQDGRGHHGRGHGGAGPGADRPDGAAAGLPAGRQQDGRLRPRADPGPRRRPGLDQPGVPRGVLGERGGRRRRSRSTSARPRSGRITEVRTSATDLDLPWWTITPFAVTDHPTPTRPTRRRPLAADEGEPAERPCSRSCRAGARLPRRYQPGARGHPPLAGRRVASRAGHRGPRARAAAGRAAPRRGPGRGRDGDLARSRAEPGLAHVATGLLESGFVWPAVRLVVLAEADMAGTRPGTRQIAADAEPPPRRHRPAAAHARRLHRARAARRRPVRGDDQPDGAGRDQGLPGDRVRAEQARPAAGPAVPADRPARRGDQVHRRRGAGAAPARRRRLGQGQGPGPQGGPRHRGRADPAVPGPDGLAGARVRARHALAARAGGRLPLRGDARPARGGGRGQGRHGDARSRWTG